MILELSKSGFHPVAAMRKAEKLFQKLKAHPLDVPNQSHSIEIMPYEGIVGYCYWEFGWEGDAVPVGYYTPIGIKK